MTGSPESAALETEGLSKEFANESGTVTALQGVSLSIGAGEITGLVGPDGAGKTTLLRLAAGLLTPSAGEIRVFGEAVRPGRAGPRGAVGYMPQRFGLYEDLSVLENLRLYGDLNGLAPAARRRKSDELLEFTGLGPFSRRLAGRLSGGMKQKLGLACTLLSEPDLLLLDEPSVGVDPVSRRELYAIVQDLVAGGIGVVWSTAYLDEAERCARVILLDQGRVLAFDRPAALTRKIEGRSFLAPIGDGPKRHVQRRAEEHPAVLDALIQGRNLRLVLHAGAAPPAPADLGLTGEMRPVPPRFEDVFVTRLHDVETRSGEWRAGSAEVMSGLVTGLRDAKGPVIEVKDLTRDFGQFRAVDKVSFAVRAGEVFGLLGPNGAGKSTTFKMLCGLLPPSSGEARVVGLDLAHAAAEARARIGYMAQKFALYGNLTVRQNLAFFAGVYGLTGRRREDRVASILEEFNLARYGNQESGPLPLGYKQRLSLSCAVLHDPDILFLDEPTSGVDPMTRREFWARINAMADAGVTILVTSHFMDEAEYCDRLAVVYRGQLVATDTPDGLKARVRRDDLPDPSLEDAFVGLIEAFDREHPL